MQDPEFLSQNIIDFSVIIFAVIYNCLVIAIFLLRAKGKSDIEAKLGPPFDLLLIPFGLITLLNVLIGSDIGRIGTLIPMIIFLGYDVWYRQFTKQKPTHHPDKWPKKLIMYLILFYWAGMAISGYSFIISQETGFMILTLFLVSILSYFFYQKKLSKDKQLLST